MFKIICYTFNKIDDRLSLRNMWDEGVKNLEDTNDFLKNLGLSNQFHGGMYTFINEAFTLPNTIIHIHIVKY